MPLVLNEEQVLLKDSARDFFANKMPVKQLRTLRDNNDATVVPHEPPPSTATRNCMARSPPHATTALRLVSCSVGCCQLGDGGHKLLRAAMVPAYSAAVTRSR